jgi:hypothetical protein
MNVTERIYTPRPPAKIWKSVFQLFVLQVRNYAIEIVAMNLLFHTLMAYRLFQFQYDGSQLELSTRTLERGGLLRSTMGQPASVRIQLQLELGRPTLKTTCS